MAINSDNGRFQITSISFSPEIVSLGEITTMAVSIKNISGAKISSANISVVPYFENDYDVFSMKPTYLLGGADRSKGSISWDNNATKTFTVSLLLEPWEVEHYIPWLPLPEVVWPRNTRLLQGHVWEGESGNGVMTALSMSFVWMRSSNELIDGFEDISGGSFTYNSTTESGEGYYDGNLKLLVYRWGLSALLSVARCDSNGVLSDEGQYLSLTSQIATNEHADTSQLACRLYYEENGPASTSSSYIDLTSYIQTLLNGVSNNYAIVQQVFANGSDWSFMLWFGDAYESVIATATISRAFANVHLAGASTGGVAFGKFSAATEGNPLFECEYPAVFDGGIAGVTNYPAIPSGTSGTEAATGGKWIDGKPIYRYVLQTTSTSTSTGAGSIGTLPSLPETIVNLYGTLTTSQSIFPINMYRPTSTVQGTACWVRLSDGAIMHQVNSPLATSRTLTVIVEYTKVTT